MTILTHPEKFNDKLATKVLRLAMIPGLHHQSRGNLCLMGFAAGLSGFGWHGGYRFSDVGAKLGITTDEVRSIYGTTGPGANARARNKLRAMRAAHRSWRAEESWYQTQVDAVEQAMVVRTFWSKELA